MQFFIVASVPRCDCSKEKKLINLTKPDNDLIVIVSVVN